MRFGYDSGTDDYKIVRISNVPCSRAEVTTIGTNTWTEIEMPIDDHSVQRLCSYAYKKGVFYWVTFSINGMILSFDMCEEMFYCIELPNEIRPAESHWRCSLMVWNDSLALLYDKCPHGYQTSDLRSIDIWVMDDNNDGGGKGSYSWIKYLTLENLNGMLAPLKFWKSDVLLMKDVDKEKFVTYNIHKKRFRDLDIGGPRQNGVSYLGTHASILVPVVAKCKLKVR